MRLEAHVATASNAPLPDIDQDSVRELLSEAWNSVNSLDMEISALEAAPPILRHRRASEMGHIKVLQTGIIAPHKKLPSELVAKMFVHTLEHDESEVGPVGLTRLPWALGQVCSRCWFGESTEDLREKKR